MRARAQPVESSRCKNGASCDKVTTVKQCLSDVRRALGRGGAGDPLNTRSAARTVLAKRAILPLLRRLKSATPATTRRST
jgi:hypothetical protein